MKENVDSWRSSNLYGTYNNPDLPPVIDEANLIFDDEYDSDELNVSFDSVYDDWPVHREMYKWFEMKTTKQRKSTKIRTMIEKLEAQKNTPTNLIFSGFYGLTANERVLIHEAMDMLVENSSRTVVACHLADSPFSDSAPLLKKEYAKYYTTKQEHLTKQVIILHNLVTNPVGYIEFNDIRNIRNFHGLTPHDNPLEKLHKMRYYTAEIRDKFGDGSRRRELATHSARRKDGGCNLREWDQILSENEPVFFDGASAMPTYPNSVSPIVSKNLVLVTANLLNPIHTSHHRALLIYRELAKLLVGNRNYDHLLEGKYCIASLLYSYVLNEYEGVIRKKQPTQPSRKKTHATSRDDDQL